MATTRSSPTETYEHLKKNAPEFEELAAMQSGFSYNPITVRRDGTGNLAQSAVGEFVSGNYFRTFRTPCDLRTSLRRFRRRSGRTFDRRHELQHLAEHLARRLLCDRQHLLG